MRFDQSFLDEIRARLPVSEVVSRRVKIQRQGREFVGLSPFKAEKTPSFTVNDQKGFYHCFASGEHGDIFKFLMTTEGLSFPEAVERLAREAGLEMPKPSPEAERRENERKGLIELMEEACRFFESQLASPAGKEARSYLDHRRVGDAQRGKFRLGFAPNGRSALKEHLAAKGYSQEDMVASGMLISGDDIPVSYDRFRNRIIFPISDAKGRIIAFGGRALDADQPAKYLNSPETPLFHKGWVLYNAATARQAAYDKGAVIAVEGYMDVIALAGAGFGNVVAPLGTALTEHQLKLLWRMAAEPILSFDGDTAGRKAAYRALETALPLLRPGYSLRFAFLPEGRDPDDLIQMEGAEAIKSVFDNARPLADVLWSKEWESGHWNTPERRAALEHRLKQLIGVIEDPLVRSHFDDYLREQLEGVWARKGGRFNQRRDPSGRRRQMMYNSQSGYQARGGNNDRGFQNRDFRQRRHGQGGRGAFDSLNPASESLRSSNLVQGTASHLSSREAVLMLTILNHPWLIAEFSEEIDAIEFESRALGELRKAILELQILQNSLDREVLHTQLSRMGQDTILDQLARAITHKSDRFVRSDASEEFVRKGWSHILALHRRLTGLKKELVSAERIYQEDMTEENLAHLEDIRNQILNA